MRHPLAQPIGDAADHVAGIAVTDQHAAVERLPLDQPDDVLDVRGQPHLRAEQVGAVGEPGQRGREHPVAGSLQPGGDGRPAPAAMPGPVDEDEGSPRPPPRFIRAAAPRSDRGFAGLAGADADHLLDGADEDLAVAGQDRNIARQVIRQPARVVDARGSCAATDCAGRRRSAAPGWPVCAKLIASASAVVDLPSPRRGAGHDELRAARPRASRTAAPCAPSGRPRRTSSARRRATAAPSDRVLRPPCLLDQRDRRPAPAGASAAPCPPGVRCVSSRYSRKNASATPPISPSTIAIMQVLAQVGLERRAGTSAPDRRP